MPNRLLIHSFVIASFVFLVFGAYGVKTAFSQTPESTPKEKTAYEKQYEEYQTRFKDYETKHQDYVIKRSQYLRFKTLTAQEDAFDSTLSMLLSRNDVMSSYFQSIREKAKEAEDVPEDIEAKLSLAIDDEMAFLNTHQSMTSTAGTLEDLVENNKEASKRFVDKEAAVAYASLGTFSLGKIQGYTRRTEENFQSLKLRIDGIKSETREGYTFSSAKFQVLDRWMFDAEARITRAKQKNSEVQTFLSTKSFILNGRNGLNSYDNAVNTLGQSQLFLKEANTFMREVIRELKVAEK